MLPPDNRSVAASSSYPFPRNGFDMVAMVSQRVSKTDLAQSRVSPVSALDYGHLEGPCNAGIEKSESEPGMRLRTDP